MSIREKIAFYLEDITTPIGLILNLCILGLILLSLLIYVAQTYSLPETTQIISNRLEFIILIIFVFEYIVRLWCAENKIKFILKPLAIMDLLAILPVFIGIFDISFFRVFRSFRILRIIRFFGFGISVFQIQKADQIVIARILLILASIIFVYAGLIYQVEHPVNPDIFRNFFDAFYFCVVTMTTVGFGDVIPLTDQGRLVTVLMILTGILLIPWQIGDLTRQLLKTTQKVKTECLNCGLLIHDFDANFCKCCGKKLEIETK
ncbi:Ion transporter [Aphanothece hegewaldii CCALA 016]|uniref:Ion transporter n=1 Tax=Aphanothece hegewaldii CCALA 016 TaxID=2107694 RepID=A0A2T1M3V5_9CHRO|nr:ion transporter [Aphanothece hegewaldii]PSF39519.1 Ion transporter [Aphanothece hegewaldii CCALA 016]